MEKEKAKYKITVGNRAVEGNTMKEVADKMKSEILTDTVLSELIQQARQETARKIFEEIENHKGENHQS